VHGSRAVGISESLRRHTRNGITELSQRAPPIFGWAAITLGISPHSSLCLYCVVVHFFWLVNVCFCCVRFCFSIPSQETGSPKWPILCWVGRKTLTSNQCLVRSSSVHKLTVVDTHCAVREITGWMRSFVISYKFLLPPSPEVSSWLGPRWVCFVIVWVFLHCVSVNYWCYGLILLLLIITCWVVVFSSSYCLFVVVTVY